MDLTTTYGFDSYAFDTEMFRPRPVDGDALPFVVDSGTFGDRSLALLNQPAAAFKNTVILEPDLAFSDLSFSSGAAFVQAHLQNPDEMARYQNFVAVASHIGFLQTVQSNQMALADVDLSVQRIIVHTNDAFSNS